jgi:phytanoyl-CoA hydroxylase
MSNILPTSSIEQFQRDGYTSAPTFFDTREIDAMRAELERFKTEGLLRNVATDGDGETHSQTTQNLQICPISPKSSFYRAFQFHPKVIDAVTALIGDPIVFYLDQIFLKPPKTGMGTNWHQDNAYFQISDPSKGTAMWVALHDATVENGTIHLIPGSHLTPFDHGRDPFSDHHIRCEVPEENAIPIELPAGGVAFFNYGVAHSTRTNQSNHERAGLALHFLNTAFIPPDKNRGFTHLTGPDATGGESEFGEVIAGSWSTHVERLASSDPGPSQSGGLRSSTP